jgi:mono/diheme cytochrome c family protein
MLSGEMGTLGIRGRGRVVAWAAAVAGVVVAGCGPDLGIPPNVCSTTAVNAGKSAEMEPGGDCIGCHSSNGGPSFVVAGTVMAALHDDTNCSGVADMTVRLTGADGQKLDLVTNVTGNFYLPSGAGTLALPFKAEVIRGDKSVAMMTPQTDTNCADCHTAAGANLAPGRILPPSP